MLALIFADGAIIAACKGRAHLRGKNTCARTWRLKRGGGLFSGGYGTPKAYHIQWNPSKADTIGTDSLVPYTNSEVSLAQGLVAGHTPVSNYDGARPWTMKLTILIRDLGIGQETKK